MEGYILERQTEQTKPMSTMFLWQKHAARKSILSCVGGFYSHLVFYRSRKMVIEYSLLFVALRLTLQLIEHTGN